MWNEKKYPDRCTNLKTHLDKNQPSAALEKCDFLTPLGPLGGGSIVERFFGGSKQPLRYLVLGNKKCCIIGLLFFLYITDLLFSILDA